jgi:hypothetical protein
VRKVCGLSVQISLNFRGSASLTRSLKAQPFAKIKSKTVWRGEAITAQQAASRSKKAF